MKEEKIYLLDFFWGTFQDVHVNVILGYFLKRSEMKGRCVESPFCSHEFHQLVAEPVNAYIFHVKFSPIMLELFVPPQHKARSRDLQVG